MVLKEPNRRVVGGFRRTLDDNEGNWTIRWRTGSVMTIGKIDSAVEVRTGERSVGLGGNAVAHDL
jgi:hypothetical protein